MDQIEAIVLRMPSNNGPLMAGLFLREMAQDGAIMRGKFDGL